ncbi:hypothetical protein LAG73_03850 [Pseudoxanthomonas japonensis]|nr:hypothetical protein LAG73_03850 [Pseudoxanthomonas japonensis]
MNPLSRVAAAGLLLFAFRPSWAGEEIRPSVERNAAPSVQLDHYARFELKPVRMDAPYAGQETNEKARNAVQENLRQGLGQWVAQRNAEAVKAEPAQTLVIEPVIEKVRFISGGKRFFAGAFAGSSRILLRLRLTDAASGELVAQPEFYQHARGMAGAWTVGGADNAMLARVASLAGDYVTANYTAQAGGSTGWEE